MANATMLASEAINQINYGDDKSNAEVLHILKVLCRYSSAETVAMIDSSGSGVRAYLGADNTWEWETVDLASRGYFEALMAGEGEAGTFIYVEESSVSGTRAVTFKHAISDSGDWLVAFYGLEDIQNSLGSDLSGDALYMIVDREGKVLAAAHTRKTSVYLRHENLYNALDSANKDEVSKMKRARGTTGTTTTGSVKVRLDNEGRSLVYTQFPVNNWQIIVGASESIVNGMERPEYAFSQSTLRNLALALGVFVIVMVGINVWSRFTQTATTIELAEKADTDLLTGLCNKVATERKVQEYFTNSPNDQAIMFVLDIDNFKKINDTMGHAFGDEVLRSLGQQITPIFRASDIIGRIGGDELIILLKNLNSDEILLKEATKVARFFHEFKAGEYVKYSATASIGAAIFPRDGKDFESMYKAADQALYMAKKRGKNQLAFYHDTFDGVVIKS
jgi:diguanylate cyclase (GGDEF)-like protein